MTNRVTFSGPCVPSPKFKNMNLGNMFRFPGSASDTVYMRIETTIDGNVISLVSGRVFAILPDRDVVPLKEPVTLTPDT